jgi:hypothetical protein
MFSNNEKEVADNYAYAVNLPALTQDAIVTARHLNAIELYLGCYKLLLTHKYIEP